MKGILFILLIASYNGVTEIIKKVKVGHTAGFSQIFMQKDTHPPCLSNHVNLKKSQEINSGNAETLHLWSLFVSN